MAAKPRVVSVRQATRDDMLLIHRLIQELAKYEGMPDGPQLTAEALERDAFDADPAWFFALVAECEGTVVGYAMCNRAYSSWTGPAMYLEDLYVVPAARRGGVARALMKALCREAVRAGVSRVDWHVLEDNPPARALYASLGARDLRESEGRLALRLDRAQILAAAE